MRGSPLRGGVVPFSLALLAGLVGLSLGHVATAADSQNRFGVRGAGLITCQVYEKERAEGSKAYFVIAGWIDGYITGVNQYASNTYDIASFESTELLTAVLSDHCKMNPQHLVFSVLNSFITQTREDRIREQSHKVTVNAAERSVQLYPEVVRRVQEALKAKGYYQAEVDGIANASTFQALGAIQREIRFEPTGFPDQATLWRLLRKP